MFKAIVTASIFGMIFPALGHSISRPIQNRWIRLSVSLLFLCISIGISYAAAVLFSWSS